MDEEWGVVAGGSIGASAGPRVVLGLVNKNTAATSPNVMRLGTLGFF